MEPEDGFRPNNLEGEIRTLVLDLERDVRDVGDLEVGTRSPDLGQMSGRRQAIASEVAVVTFGTWWKKNKISQEINKYT